MDLAQIKDQLPYYLTMDRKLALVEALRQFRDGMNWCVQGTDEILQGDGWSNLQAVNFATLKKRDLKGIIVSNSCDVSVENKRDLPSNILFAPLLTLDDFLAAHVKAGVPEERIHARVTSIRRQEITDLFFLPKNQFLDVDHVALLGHIQSMPLEVFIEEPARAKQFELTMEAFYLFIMKLSFHFCRFHEEVLRD